MLRMGIGAAAVGMVAALVVAWIADDDTDACERTVSYDSTSYVPWETSEEVISARDLGSGIEHGCGRTGPYKRDLAINETPGVDPSLALATPTESNTLWLANGVEPSDLPDQVAATLVQRRP